LLVKFDPPYSFLMTQYIQIPQCYRKFTNGDDFVEVNAANVEAAIIDLLSRFTELKKEMTDDHGALRRFVNVYVNKEDLRFLQNRQTPLKDGDEIIIVPPILD